MIAATIVSIGSACQRAEVEGQAAVDEDQALRPGCGMAVSRHHGDEGAHRVADDGGPLDADVVEHGDEVVGVGRHRERSGDAVGAPAAAQIGGEQR